MSENTRLNFTGSFNSIKTDTSLNNKNLLFITGNPNAKIDLSTNEVFVRNNISISGSIINQQITNIIENISTLNYNVGQLTSNITISGISFESIDTNFARPSDISNILNIINTLDISFVTIQNLNTFINTLDISLLQYAKLTDLSAYVLDASLNDYAKLTDLSAYVLDASLNDYAKLTDLSAYVLDASLNDYAKLTDLSAYVLDASLNDYAKLTDLFNELSSNFITPQQLDASLSSITISGDFITRQQLDASFESISSITISGDFVSKNHFELSFNDLQNRSDNFFFFFKFKPWSLVYIDGSYNYPISNYGNSFTYNLGNYNNSFIDNFSSTTKNLQLLWKIPPRIFLDSTLTINNINYLPIYNNLIVEFKEQNEVIWRELLNINNFPDPSNNSSFPNYNNKNDENMVFVFNLTRNTGQTNDTNIINIIDNSFNINYSGGLNNFQNSKAYQFRIFLSNISNLENSFDYKVDSYSYDTSNIYLYFPDNSGEYFLTASRGLPKSPTNLTFISVQFNNTTINGSLNDSTADANNIISIPLESNDDNDNKLVFVLSLLANKNSNYKKFIPYSFNNYNLHNISNSSNPSVNGQFSILQTNNIEPEFTYDLSNYGMYFANDTLNISYANNILGNSNIDNNFTTPHPLRNQVNSTFNNFINNSSYSLFNSDLINYNSNLEYKTIKWRENNQNYNLYFFNDSNSVFNINSNNLNYKLFNSLKSIIINNINTINEPIGIDFINNSLCSFIMYSQKIKNSITSDIYNAFTIDTSFNNFLTKYINENNNNFTLNYISQDILPNGVNSINDYSSKNGYYVGLILNDISYNIDLNDFFDVLTDLCFNNIQLKTKLTQQFDNESYDKEESYAIYKITDDLSQNITLDSSSSSFNLTYNESNQGTYFGLTSIKPHNSVIDLSFSGLLTNLSKYIRSSTNDILSTINLKVSGSLTSNNSININWEQTSNNNIQNINHNYNYNPLSSLNPNYGFYEGNYLLNGLVDITIYNNVFSQSQIISHNNLTLGNAINISNKYYWNIGRLGTSNNYFKDTNMIVFNNNPLNDSYNVYSGINYDPYDITSNGIIKYNQALYQNNGLGLFYSTNNNSIYKDYSIYSNNNNSNLDYSLFNNSGDTLNYTISNFFFNGLSSNINNTFKWICFDLDLTSNPLASDNITLEDSNISVGDIGSKIVFYIKLKYVNTSTDYYYNPFARQYMTYSSWLDCQSILSGNPNYVSSTNLAGIFSNNSPFGTYPLPLTLPNLSSKATNLILLVGIGNGYNFNINNLNINFNV